MKIRGPVLSVSSACEQVLRTLPECAETRRLYEALGDLPLEVHPTLWSEDLPVLQLVKCLDDGGVRV